jgi:hypothetical protein
MDEGRWADQKANEVRAKREKQSTDQQTRLLEDRQRVAEAPRLWDEFVAKVRDRVKAFNQALREDALEIRTVRANEISVGIHQFVTKISAEFTHTPRLEIRCAVVNTIKEYSFSVIHGKVTLAPAKGDHPGALAVTPDEAAEEFVNSIIQFL